MKVLKIATISLVGLGMLVGVSASADQPSTRPDAVFVPVRPSPQNGSAHLQAMLRAVSPGKTTGIRPATPEEWEDMMKFMRQYSHARAKVLDSIQIDHNSPVALEAIRKFRNYVFTAQHFPAITDDLRSRFVKEDDLFYLMLADRASADSSESLEYRDKIHDKVAEIVQLEIQIRQKRIDRLASLLAEEKSNQQKEEANEDAEVDARTDQIIKRLEKHNSNYAPPTTRPQVDGAAEDVPASALHEAVANIPDETSPSDR